MYDEHVIYPPIRPLPFPVKDCDGACRVVDPLEVETICHHLMDGWSDERIAFYYSHIQYRVIRDIRRHDHMPRVTLDHIFPVVVTPRDKCYSVANLSLENPDLSEVEIARIEHVHPEYVRECLNVATQAGYY